jgi:hypothetical protein
MYLEKILADDNVTDTGGRKLFSKKLTSGERAAPIELITGEGGALLRVDEPVAGGPFNFAAAIAEIERHKQAFLEMLAKFTAQKMAVSSKSGSKNYAPKEFVKREGGKGRVAREVEYEKAMFDLLDVNRIANEPDGPPSSPPTGPHGERASTKLASPILINSLPLVGATVYPSRRADDLAVALALTLCFQGRMRDHKSGPRSPCRFNSLDEGAQ